MFFIARCQDSARGPSRTLWDLSMSGSIRDDVDIGRGSKWGNRFVIGRDGSRDDVISKYREWILKNDELLGCLEELKDKVLGCYCKPLACHGDVLVELSYLH